MADRKRERSQDASQAARYREGDTPHLEGEIRILDNVQRLLPLFSLPGFRRVKSQCAPSLGVGQLDRTPEEEAVMWPALSVQALPTR